jgi:hypothetical protein
MRHTYSENAFRKQRTRTLIQIGGLLEKSGLLDQLEIAPGDDLQKDAEALPKAAILFGALLEIADQLNDNSEQQKLLWEQKGKSVLYAKE